MRRVSGLRLELSVEGGAIHVLPHGGGLAPDVSVAVRGEVRVCSESAREEGGKEFHLRYFINNY